MGGSGPISTTTQVCDLEGRNKLSFHDTNIFVSEFQLSERNYIVSYKSNRIEADEAHWNAPTNSAVHLSAAITAYSRIHMYPYISREDCFYTDTYSVVLGSPLPDDVISSTELGMFKLEYRLDEAYFLAPKTYFIHVEGQDKPIIKAKGPAHDHLDHAWFKEAYANPELVKSVLVSYDFRISWDSLFIGKKPGIIRIGNLHLNTKRIPIFGGEENLWIDTLPKDIFDISISYLPDVLYLESKEVKAKYEVEKQQLLDKGKESTEAINTLEAEKGAALEALIEREKAMMAALEEKNKALSLAHAIKKKAKADRLAKRALARALAQEKENNERLRREIDKLQSAKAGTESKPSSDGSSTSSTDSKNPSGSSTSAVVKRNPFRNPMKNAFKPSGKKNNSRKKNSSKKPP